MAGITVAADFHEDIRAQLLAELDEADFVVPSDVVGGVEAVCEFYFNVRWKLLPTTKRNVHESHELRGNTLRPGFAEVINVIKARSLAGHSLAAFLSKKLTREPDYDDPLLNEWGIYHFHLGSRVPQPDWYVARRGELLFAFAQPRDLYLLDIRDHHAFQDDGLVDVLHQNWPHVIEPYRAVGFARCRSEPKMSAATRRKARKAGLSVVTEVSDGTLYVAPGGGYMCSGLSSRVLSQSDDLLNLAKRLEDQCRARANELAKCASHTAGRLLTTLHLNLNFDDGPGSLSVIETQSGHVFPARG